MKSEDSRYIAADTIEMAENWSVARVTSPSKLFGANGIRNGPDGRLYVAQMCGSQISAIDVNTGAIDTISPTGGEIVGPDDIAFDSRGNLYAAELTEGRVCVRTPGGKTRIIWGDVPFANPITVYQDRVFAGECRPGGRVMEFDLNGGAPRILLENVPMPNAFEVGPDGKLYMPVMGTNEIWRVDLHGGAAETVAGDLGIPDAVKFDRSGRIISTQALSGEVLRIDPQTGQKELMAALTPGIDNLAFVGDRLFVSHASGHIDELLGDGGVRSLVRSEFTWPLGITANENGELVVGDGVFTHSIDSRGNRTVLSGFFSPGCPGYIRGVAFSANDELIVTTGMGAVARWWPRRNASEILATGFDQLYGVSVRADGSIYFAETGTGRVWMLQSGETECLATNLLDPVGIAADAAGCFVSEAGAGRILKLAGGRPEVVLDGLVRPQGVAVHEDRLYIVDVGSRALVELDLTTGSSNVIAKHLPVGAPTATTPKPLKSIAPISGPMGPYADIAIGYDGRIYISADAEGSILVVSKNPAN
jgi:sugar lactone lactonase YvrE